MKSCPSTSRCTATSSDERAPLAKKILKRGEIHGLHQMRIEAGIVRAPAILFPAVSRHRHERDSRGRVSLAQCPGHLVAIEPRKLDIHEHHLRLPRGRMGERRTAVMCNL